MQPPPGEISAGTQRRARILSWPFSVLFVFFSFLSRSLPPSLPLSLPPALLSARPRRRRPFAHEPGIRLVCALITLEPPSSRATLQINGGLPIVTASYVGWEAAGLYLVCANELFDSPSWKPGTHNLRKYRFHRPAWSLLPGKQEQFRVVFCALNSDWFSTYYTEKKVSNQDEYI